MVESFLVPYDFDSHRLASTMIATMKNLAKGSFAQEVDDFISVR